MKKRICSFLLVLGLVTAQFSGIVFAAEPAGDVVTEETAETAEPAEEAVLASTGIAADEVVLDEAEVETDVLDAIEAESEALSAADAEALDTAEAEADELSEEAEAAEKAVPQDPKEDQTKEEVSVQEDMSGTDLPAPEEDITEIEETADTMEVSNTPQNKQLEEVKISITKPQAGRLSSAVKAKDCVKIADGSDIVIESARWISYDGSYWGGPDWEGTFNSTDTYYIQVKLVDGKNDWLAAKAGGSSFDTVLTVSGGTNERQGNGAETKIGDDGNYSGNYFLLAVISVTAAPFEPGSEDVWVDHTEDKSVSTVSGVVSLTGAVGTQAGYNPGKTIYGPFTEYATFSEPKSYDVKYHIDSAEKAVYDVAKQVRAQGTAGEYHMSTSESTGKVWDNRKYETTYQVTGPDTTSPIDVTRVGETDTYKDEQGNTYTSEDYRIHRIHTASGDYGKETFYKVEASGWVGGDEKPGKTSKVTVYNVAQGIKVTWNKVDGATSYLIYRDGLDGKGYKYLFKTSKLEVTDLEVRYELGKKFRYKVVATSKTAGDSDGFRTSTYYRLMPTGITSVKNTGAGKMTVTYDKSDGGSGYVVRYGLKKDMSDAKVITVKGSNTTSRTFSGLKKGQTYYVQVRTYKIEDGIRYYSGYCLTKTVKIVK